MTDTLELNTILDEIFSHSEQNLFKYYIALGPAIVDPKNESCRKELEIVRHVCSLIITYNNKGFTLFRNTCPSSIVRQNEDLIFELCKSTRNSILRSALADSIWTFRGQNKLECAELAIDSYCNFLKDPEIDSFYVMNALGRAYSIAIGIVAYKDELVGVVKSIAIDYLLNNIDNAIPPLVEILTNHTESFDEVLNDLCMSCGKACENGNKYDIARCFYDIAVKFQRKQLNQDETIIATQRKIAETYYAESKTRPEALFRCYCLELAYCAYGKIKDLNKQKVIFRELSELQADKSKEMTTVYNGSVDPSEFLPQTITLLKDKSLIEALCIIGWLPGVIDVAKIREYAIELARSDIMSQIFPITHIYPNGIKPKEKDYDSDNDLTQNEKIHFARLLNAEIFRRVHGFLVPALSVFNSLHYIEYAHFSSLFRDHPLIPESHRPYFSRAFYSGLQFDFPSANSFLLPQAETLLRSIVKNQGGIDSSLTLQGQEVILLDSLLVNKDVEKVLGTNKLELLKRLMTDPKLLNLRHSYAHGFLDYSLLGSENGIYFWWLILNIIMGCLASIDYLPQISCNQGDQ